MGGFAGATARACVTLPLCAEIVAPQGIGRIFVGTERLIADTSSFVSGVDSRAHESAGERVAPVFGVAVISDRRSASSPDSAPSTRGRDHRVAAAQ